MSEILRATKAKAGSGVREYAVPAVWNQSPWHGNAVLSLIPQYSTPLYYKNLSYTNRVSYYYTDATAKVAHYKTIDSNGDADVTHDSLSFLRFIRPINPVTYGSRIIIRGAGGRMTSAAQGEVTAVIRYTLMSVNWDETVAGFTYTNQPAPAADDPYIEIELKSNGISGGTPYGDLCHITKTIEFTDVEDKLYYGIKSEIKSVTGGEVVVDCSSVEVPTSVVTGAVSYSMPGQVCEFALPSLCTDPSVQCPAGGAYSYYEGSCYVEGTLGAGTCEPFCDEFEENGEWVTYYGHTCTHPFNLVSITGYASANIKVDMHEDCRVHIYGTQPKTELVVNSRRTASNLGYITTADPHGLSTHPTMSQYPCGANGIDSKTPISITHSSRTGGYVTLTVPGHGLSAGDYVQVVGSRCGITDSIPRYIYSVAGDTIRIASTGDNYSITADAGVVWRVFYDQVSMWGALTVMDANTLRFSRTGANESLTTCGGVLYLM